MSNASSSAECQATTASWLASQRHGCAILMSLSLVIVLRLKRSSATPLRYGSSGRSSSLKHRLRNEYPSLEIDRPSAC